MSTSGWNAIADRYGPAAAREWQVLLNQFNLGHGFALLVLGVPDRDGAALCRTELENFLTARSMILTRIEPERPDDLAALASTLLETPRNPMVGALWIAAVVGETAEAFPAWQAAWRQVLTGLNRQRNPFRRHFTVPVIVVGAPWVAQLMRDAAPDLWSVRSIDLTIEPGPPPNAADHQTRDLEPRTYDGVTGHKGSAPNPNLALTAAERLRAAIAVETDPAAIARHERSLAGVLERAGKGLAARRRWTESADAWREVATLWARDGADEQAAGAWMGLGDILSINGQTVPALASFRASLAIAERLARADPGNAGWQRDLSVSHNKIGDVLVHQGDLPAALASFRASLAIAERLAQADPGNVGWQRDLSVSHN